MCNLYCCFNRMLQLEWQLCASLATQEELCAWICNSVQDQISRTRSAGPDLVQDLRTEAGFRTSS